MPRPRSPSRAPTHGRNMQRYNVSNINGTSLASIRRDGDRHTWARTHGSGLLNAASSISAQAFVSCTFSQPRPSAFPTPDKAGGSNAGGPMKASCLHRRHSQLTAAHVTCQYSGPFPLARWHTRGCSGVCLVAAPKPRPTPLVLHPGARDGDDRRAASMALRYRGRDRRRGWCVPLAMVARMVRAARPPKPPPPRPPRPPPPPPRDDVHARNPQARPHRR